MKGIFHKKLKRAAEDDVYFQDEVLRRKTLDFFCDVQDEIIFRFEESNSPLDDFKLDLSRYSFPFSLDSQSELSTVSMNKLFVLLI